MEYPHNTITPIPAIDPLTGEAPFATPDLFNIRFAETDENFAVVKDEVESTQQDLATERDRIDETIDDIDTQADRITDIENNSAESVSTALRLDWLYQTGIKFALELFYDSWTLLPHISTQVTDAVAGDDSLDVADTEPLAVDREYVLSDTTHAEPVVISTILTGTRVRIDRNLEHSYGEDAVIKRCNWDLPGGMAVARNDGYYYVDDINLGVDDQDKAVVIRREDNDTAINVFFKDADHEEWTPAPWGWRREIEPGLVDIEYPVPARGTFKIKITTALGQDSGAAIEHLAITSGPTNLGGEHHPPETPVNDTPAHEAINIQETPTLSVLSYVHELGTIQGGVQFQLSLQEDFSILTHDSGIQPAGISYPIPEGILTENESYYWRARLEDSLGGWSEWSDATFFTCASAFTYIITPSNIGPGTGAADVAEQPTLSASAFLVSGTTDTHQASQWRIRLDSQGWDTPVYDSGEVTDMVSHVVPAGVLLEGENTYYFQTRYQGAALGWSDWSQETSFTTKDVFALIMGLALTTSGGGAGSWQHIDGDGNNIIPGAAYFDNHPVWGDMQDVTIDSQAMVKVPKFYCKVGTLDSGDQAGKKAWLISDQPAAGFELHPAFMDDGVEIDQFYFGKYEAANDGGTMVKSAAGVAPLTSTSITDFKTLCAARNTGGVDGFHLVNIYELAAVQMLALVELGTPDTQSAIDPGNNTGSVQNTGVASDIYRGIYQLWSNVYSFVDGLKVTSAGDLQIFDKNGNSTYVTAASGISGSAFNGWPVSMRDNAGADFDCKFLFLAEVVDDTESNGTFADYQYYYQSTEDYFARHGGNWNGSSDFGLFYLSVNNTASGTSTSCGARLAKV